MSTIKFRIDYKKMDSVKKCRLCQKEKSLSDFSFRKDSGKYRNECKECCNLRSRIYRSNNANRIRELNRRYRELHLDRLKDYSKEYQRTHLEKFREYNKKYRDNCTDIQKEKANLRSRLYIERQKDNPIYQEKRKQWNRESSLRRRKKITAYETNRKKYDPIFKLKKQVRNEIRESFNRRGFRKSKHTESIVGCDLDFLYDYLINTFTDRYGREFQSGEAVHIDHIIPLVTATTENEVLKLCHYKNLQLLTAEDNLAKGSLEDSAIVKT